MSHIASLKKFRFEVATLFIKWQKSVLISLEMRGQFEGYFRNFSNSNFFWIYEHGKGSV